MIKKIIEISHGKCFLSVKLGQLIVRKEDEPQRSIPIEDIGVLLIDNQATIYTHCVMTELLDNNCAVVLCGSNHHPTGMLLPLSANSTQRETFGYQINAKEPLKKRLWQQIIKTKIKHQAKIVKDCGKTYSALKAMADRVKSGDPENLEAQASRKYWPVFIQDTLFRRDMNGIPPNNLLNYGYTVLRAAVARSLVSSGLLPTLGIHHRNRYNAYCLADDIIEPFRGFVDAKVRDIA
ncbi:MAG: type II CRISPR-associated endonuclease Cas1 [Anaerohalosphaeraceae bacterium]|nr:type II CRISPR-associated endonuclease Cas1 [Anaerohalosphaeraceae bacterium]